MLKFVNRQNTNSFKWDGLTPMFGEEGLHAMWVADMDIATPDCVQKALHDYVDLGTFGYMKVPDSYYDACIRWEKEHHGYEVKKDWIRFSPGVVAAFNWCVRFLTSTGDSVIVNTPVYYPFLNAVKDSGRNLVTSELVVEDGEYRIDFADFEAKVRDNNVKLFIFCSPHNPVGRVWTRDELTQLMAICRKYNVYVVADEIHQDLIIGSREHIPTATVADMDDLLISLYAPSKTFNLAAGQNSEVIIPDAGLRKKWDAYMKDLSLMGGNGFGYVAAEAAYTGGAEWLEEVVAQVRENYGLLKSGLEGSLPGVVVYPLEGTYLAWVDLRAVVAPEDVTDFMQKKCRMAVDYGEWFGGDQFKGFIRVNLATSPENVQIAVDRMVAAAKG